MLSVIDKLFGRSVDDYDEDYEDNYAEYEQDQDDRYEDMVGEDERYAYPLNRPVPPRAERSRVVDIHSAGSNRQQEVVIMAPHNADMAKQVCDEVRQGKTVVCNLESVDFKLHAHVIDFLMGAAYALNGTIKGITNMIFIITPNNTVLRTTMSEREQEDTYEEDSIRRTNVFAR